MISRRGVSYARVCSSRSQHPLRSAQEGYPNPLAVRKLGHVNNSYALLSTPVPRGSRKLISFARKALRNVWNSAAGDPPQPRPGPMQLDLTPVHSVGRYLRTADTRESAREQNGDTSVLCPSCGSVNLMMKQSQYILLLWGVQMAL